MTSPTRRTTDRARPRLTHDHRTRAHGWMRRLTTSVTAVTAGGVLLLGAPVTAPGGPAPTPSPGSADSPDPGLDLVSAERHPWRGHPGRTLVRYRVRPGDTATGLAVRFHAWTAELRAVNHLGRHATLVAGRRVSIPVVRSAARHARAMHARHHRVRQHHAPQHHHAQHHHARHHHKPWRHADASRAQVRRLVARTARRHGVDPSLALAISWQESGWQQRRRSSAGAVGAMQVIPGTGRWMSLYAGRKLNIYSLRDNVVAGVLLYKVLRSETSWRRSIAAYYQGLGSVRSHGLYPSTKRYTRNVLALHRRIHRGWNPV